LKPKKKLNIGLAVLLLWVFLAGQASFSFHLYHHSHTKHESNERSKQGNEDCSVCQLNIHPALSEINTLQIAKPDVISHRYFIGNLLLRHAAVVYTKCGRGPPFSA